jgi:hypothetical protein
MAENTLDNPTRIAPQHDLVPTNGYMIENTLAANSFTVLKIYRQ